MSSKPAEIGRPARVRNPAAAHGQLHQFVRTPGPQAHPMIANQIAHPGPPAEAVGITGHRLHSHVDLQSSQPAQLFGQYLRLQLALPRHRNMLKVAAPAAAGYRARWDHPVGTRLNDLGDLAPPHARLGIVGDAHPHPLTRNAVPDEHHAPVEPSDAVTAVGYRAQLDAGIVRHGIFSGLSVHLTAPTQRRRG